MGITNTDLAKLIARQDKRIYNLEEHFVILNREMGEVTGLLRGIKAVEKNNNDWLKRIFVASPATIAMVWFLEYILTR